MNNIHGQRLNNDILEAARLRLRRQPRPRLPAHRRPGVADSQPALRPRRQGVHHRLVRHERLPPQQRRGPRPHATAGSTRSATATPKREAGRSARSSATTSWLSWSLDKNDWYVRHARRILQERAAAGKLDERRRASAWPRSPMTQSGCNAPAAGDVGAARHRRTAGRR